MKRIMNGLAAVLFAVMIAGALTFGATQALSAPPTATPSLSCTVGTCPPFDDTSCNNKCQMLGFDGGGCLAGCCTCLE